MSVVDVLSSIVSSTLHVSGGETLDVLAGGSALDVSVTVGGTVQVHGVDLFALISGGTEQVFNGGIASNTVIAGGSAVLGSDGVTFGSTGEQSVQNGGSAAYTEVNAGGRQDISAGGKVTSAAVDGGVQYVSAGGTAVSTTVGSVFAVIPLAAGGNVTILASGEQFVLAQGSASATTVSAGGAQYVASKGVAIDTHVVSGGVQVLAAGATAEATSVLTSGTLEFAVGASATSLAVAAGGVLAEAGLVLTGSNTVLTLKPISAALSNLTIGRSALLSNVDETVSATVSNGATLQVDSGGAAFSTQVDAGGLLRDEGDAAGTVVNKGGRETVTQSGAQEFDPTIESSGALSVGGGGVVMFGVVAAGGTLTAGTSGAADFTTISAGGSEVIGVSGVDYGALVQAGASIVVSGGFAFSDAVAGTETAKDSGLASGTDLSGGGLLLVATGGSGAAPVLDGGTVEVLAGGTLMSGLMLSGTGNLLDLGDGTTIGTTVSGFAHGDTIDFATLAYHAGATATFNSTLDVIDVTDGTSGFSFAVNSGATYAPNTLYMAPDAGSGTALEVACFWPGTRLATPGGEAAVETLRTGDSVRLAEGGEATVRWVGRQTVSQRFADVRRILPVRIRAGALGDGLPARDLLISPGHALGLEGVLVHAGALLNGRTIVQERPLAETFTYWHVELDCHALLLAEGVPAESYLETVEGGGFDNIAERQSLAEAPEMERPRARAARQVPATLRARLARRAITRIEAVAS